MLPLAKRASRLTLGGYAAVIRARDKAFCLASRHAFSSYGRRSVLQLPVRLRGTQRIAIGDDVFVGAGSWIQVIGNDDGPPAISIGSGTSISGFCFLSAVSSIRLGRAVLLARNVYVADHRHAYDDPALPVLAQGLTRIGPVEIQDGAWLGQNVVIGPGVTVGRGAVIGANSVVIDDVPAYAVAVGAPARVVRRFADDEGRAL